MVLKETDRLDASGRLLIVPFLIGQRSARTLLRLEELSNRIVAGFAEIAERKEFFGCGGLMKDIGIK
jgi:hypothetical protein